MCRCTKALLTLMQVWATFLMKARTTVGGRGQRASGAPRPVGRPRAASPVALALHGEETCGFGDAGYRGAEKREEVKALHPAVQWFVAMRPGRRKALDTSDPHDAITEQIEKIKAGVRAKVEHPFRVIKRQFGHVKTRYRGLAKNTAQLITLFALSNLWMVRRSLLQGVQG